MNQVIEIQSKTSAILKNPCLNTMFEELYKQRHETGDIKFAVDSEEIHAHRNILAALSPKFKAQFYGGMAEKGVIHVHDVAAGAFNEFLQFFYAEKVTLTIKNIEDVLNLAKQSLVDALVDACIQFLKNMVEFDKEKSLWCYQLALRYGTKELEELCGKKIKMNIQNVFKAADFLSCERELLCHILELEPMNCNEMAVLNGCISWARAKCELEGLDTEDIVNLRAALGDAIYKIRFCSMTGEEFAEICYQFPGLLSPQESTEVFQTISRKSKGETSIIFGEINNKSRGSMQPPNFECSFRTGTPRRFDELNSDYMEFTCNQAIELNGFVTHSKIDGNIRVTVATESDGEVQIEEYTKLFLESETKIIFANAIRIGKDEECRIRIYFERSKQCNESLYGFNALESVEQNGVTFKSAVFNYINLIISVIFNVVN